MYNTKIFPYLQYCSIIGPLRPTLLTNYHLFASRKRLFESYWTPPRAHSYPLFKTLEILYILKICKYQVSCFAFLHTQKKTKNKNPAHSSLFISNSDFHKYSTWQKDDLHIYSQRYSFSVRVQGPKIWNNLPLCAIH